MAELVFDYETRVVGPSGQSYGVRCLGETAAGGTWIGWLEFRALDADGPLIRTERETTQPDFSALRYWASGLEPVYLGGALARAR